MVWNPRPVPAAVAHVLGAVDGYRMRLLGVEHFGQTGIIAELYCHFGIDTNAIMRRRNRLIECSVMGLLLF
jgi:pyruvate dehydrogenase E1 component